VLLQAVATVSRYEPYSYRLTAEYDSREQAEQARMMLRSTAPRLFVYDALDSDGEPLWHEEGSLHFRPETSA